MEKHIKDGSLLTAEEFSKNFTTSKESERTQEHINSMLIEFAKLHVEAALKAAAQKAQIHRKPTGEGESSEEYISNSFEGDLGYEDHIPVEYSIYKESILNAYLLTNIK